MTFATKRINGARRVFSRVFRRDGRDGAYVFEAAAKPKKLQSKVWKTLWNGDQGNTPQCTAYAGLTALYSAPVVPKCPTIPAVVPEALYNIAQYLDEWAGENYEGSSVRAIAKAGKALGVITSYQWATTADDLAAWISTKGAALLGINWYEGMCEPDKSGLVKPTGEIVGGHAISCLSVDPAKRLFGLLNTWGKTWGKQGWCYLSFEDLDRLLREDGEALLPVKKGRRV